MQQLLLVKGEHRYLFRYFDGREKDVMRAFIELASDRTTEFDWFDAAVLSHQMGQQLELDEFRA